MKQAFEKSGLNTTIDRFCDPKTFEQYIEVFEYPYERLTFSEYEKLSLMEKTQHRDGVSVLNKTEKNDKIYRTIVPTQLKDILKYGQLVTPKEAGIRGKNKKLNESGEYEGRNTLQFYRGHASSRYGGIVIEAPDRPFKTDELIIHIKNSNGKYLQSSIKALQNGQSPTNTLENHL
jgi:hypothetical protein